MTSQTPNPFQFLEQQSESSILLTSKIDIYINKNNKRCINQFEIISNIGRGLMWRVSKVRRYYYNDNNEICYKYYAMKKSHIRSLKNMRYYVDDEVKDYFEKVVNEVKAYSLLQSNQNEDSEIDYFPRLYEVLYDHSHEENQNLENENIYIILDLCEGGGLMGIDYIKNRYYHNYLLFKYITNKDYSWCCINNEYEDEDEEDWVGSNENEECLVNNKGINELIDDADKEKVFLYIFPQIIKGLMHLHSNCIVYSDLKPENVCLKLRNMPIWNEKSLVYSKDSIVNSSNSSNKPYTSSIFNDIHNVSISFIDFSISSITSSSQPEIFNQGGTINFQSPEQFTSSKYNGYASDIWALGVMIFLFFNEELPFDSESELESQIKIMKIQVNYEKFGFFQRKNPFSQLIFKVLQRIFVDYKERIGLLELYNMIQDYISHMN